MAPGRPYTHPTRFQLTVVNYLKLPIRGGGSCINFQPCFRGGSVIFVPKGGGGDHVFFINHISNTSSAFALIYLKSSPSRFLSTLDDEDPDYMDYAPPLFAAEDEHSSCTSARSVSRCVNIEESPYFKAFYRHYPVQLTLDTGAETSMIKSSLVRPIGAQIGKSSQQALQADGLTLLAVVVQTLLDLSRADKKLALYALVVDDLDVDALAGTPFIIANNISVRPAKCQVRIQDSEVIHYEHMSARPLLPMLCDVRNVIPYAHHPRLFFGLVIT